MVRVATQIGKIYAAKFVREPVGAELLMQCLHCTGFIPALQV